MPSSTLWSRFLTFVTRVPLSNLENPPTTMYHLNTQTYARPEPRKIEDLPQEMICRIMDCILYTNDVAPLRSLAAFISSSPKIYASFLGHRQAMIRIQCSETGQEGCSWNRTSSLEPTLEPRTEKRWTEGLWWDTMRRALELRSLLNQHSNFDANTCKFKGWESKDWKRQMPVKAWLGYEIICTMDRSTSDDSPSTGIAPGRLDGHRPIRQFLNTLSLPELDEQMFIWREIFRFYLRLLKNERRLFMQMEGRYWAVKRIAPDYSLGGWLFILQALTKLGVSFLRKVDSATPLERLTTIFDAINDMEPVKLEGERVWLGHQCIQELFKARRERLAAYGDELDDHGLGVSRYEIYLAYRSVTYTRLSQRLDWIKKKRLRPEWS